jgi:hypothetical protein
LGVKNKKKQHIFDYNSLKMIALATKIQVVKENMLRIKDTKKNRRAQSGWVHFKLSPKQSRRVGCSELMKFFLQKPSISTHLPSLTGRGMVVGDPCFYQHSVPNGTGNSGGKNRPVRDEMLVEMR